MAYAVAIIARNTALDALGALLNTGYLRVYSGAKPATPETAASGTLLAELRFGASAFAAAAAGSMSANAITADSSADNTGTAGWCRCLKSDGTSAVLDGTVGAEFTLNSTAISAGANVSCTGMTVTL